VTRNRVTVESRFLETPDNSNQFFFPWDKLTLDNLNLRKFRNNLVRMSITSTPSGLTRISPSYFNHTISKPQICHQSERYNDYLGFPYLIVFLKLLPQYIDKFRCPLTQCELRHAVGVLNTFSFFADDAHLDNLRKRTRTISQIIDQCFSNAKRQQVITNYFS